VADRVAPGIRAESLDVFVLGEVDGLEEGLEHIGDGASGLWFYVATKDGGDDTGQGGAEIAGGEVVAGEEVVQVFAEFMGGEGVGFFLGVVVAEVGMGGEARGAATAAVGEGEQAEGYAVLCFERGHKSLLLS
jgi:hypothetical protein